ncbi:MAG: response regulator, partial [Smithellaceae bacterium]|nr:response regulator [Smithellaceae bacterium]
MNYNTVLVIDDDGKFSKTMVDILRVKGYEASGCGSGREGMESIREKKPAVALVDIRMDDISGLEIIRQIKSDTLPTECIILTGYSSHAVAIEAVNVGAYQYLQKPFDIEQLLLTIHRAVEKRRSEDALLLSMERLQNLIENAQEGIFQITPDGRCIMANQAMANIVDYRSPEEMSAQLSEGL